jgi:F-type H+-transporting ATPase subunit b
MLDFSVTLIITVLNIVFLTFVLRKILFKPVSKFVADRAKRVRDSIDAASADREQAQSLLSQYRGKMEAAETEAREIVMSATAKARVQAERIVSDGKAEAIAIVDDARKQIELERQKAFTRFTVEATALVMAAASRLVQREFSGDDSRRYADMLISELAATASIRKGNG